MPTQGCLSDHQQVTQGFYFTCHVISSIFPPQNVSCALPTTNDLWSLCKAQKSKVFSLLRRNICLNNLKLRSPHFNRKMNPSNKKLIILRCTSSVRISGVPEERKKGTKLTTKFWNWLLNWRYHFNSFCSKDLCKVTGMKKSPFKSRSDQNAQQACIWSTPIC